MTAKQDETYLSHQVSSVLSILANYDHQLSTKITSFFAPDSPNSSNRIQQSFALIIKKFTESLGFNLLNVDCTLFLWDQIFLKQKKNSDELYTVFCVLLLCEKEELMMINRWLDFAEMIYLKGKAINLQSFMSKYSFVFGDSGVYASDYDYQEIPVDAIKLDKIGVGNRPELDMPENFALGNLRRNYVDSSGRVLGSGLGLGGTEDSGVGTDEDRMISDQMEQIMKNNVILEQSDEQLAEGRGVFVDESILKSVNDYEGGMEAGILDDMTGKGAKARKKPVKGGEVPKLDLNKAESGVGELKKKGTGRTAGVSDGKPPLTGGKTDKKSASKDKESVADGKAGGKSTSKAK